MPSGEPQRTADQQGGDETALESEEFDDTRGDVSHLARYLSVDLEVLRQPVVVRSIAGAAVAIAILVWPGRSDEILARLIGLGLAVLGGITLWGSFRNRAADRLQTVGAAAFVLIGLALLAAPPERAGRRLGWLIGGLALLTALRLVIDVAQGKYVERAWPLAQAGLLASSGLLLLRFPESLLQTVIALVGLGWLALSLIVISRSLDPTVKGMSSYTDATSVVADWLRDRPKSADDRQALYGTILYEGPNASKRVGRFFTLMGFASVIATGGVIGDSTAVVIGAMLIAPLMTPLMGMAISLVMGWPNRLLRSGLVALAGILFAIAIGIALGLTSPTAFDAATNSQIVARTSPTTLDLLVAVAAGAAGAYGLSRPDVSDSLPGVAIAISLVPPLSVVGLSFSQGDWSSGGGALLLFATNMLAILIVGGVMFVITGVTPIARLTENQHRTRTSLAAVAGVATFVIGALLLNGSEIARNIATRSHIEGAVESWLDPHVAHDVVDVRIDGDTVTAVIIGPSDGAPEASTLANSLTAELDRETTAIVRLVVEERHSATGVSRP